MSTNTDLSQIKINHIILIREINNKNSIRTSLNKMEPWYNEDKIG